MGLEEVFAVRFHRAAGSCCTARFSSILSFGLGLLTAVGLQAAPLNVTADLDLPEDTTASYDNISVSNGAVLTIGGGSGITVAGAVTVTGNASIVFAGKNVDAQVAGEWQGEGSSLTAASVTVDAGSAIHADGQGYTSAKGPGAPAGNTNTTGASYGGIGTFSSPVGLRPTYGSTREPVDLGSASGVFGAATYGGGAIRLIVSGSLTVNGRLSADGTIVGTNHSGATGGSIWVTAGAISGGGSIRANASEGGLVGSSRDSGGGRLALYLGDTTALSALAELDANGFDGSQNGTVFIEDTAGADQGLIVNGRVRYETDEALSFQSVTIDAGGILQLAGGSSLSVTGDLNVGAGGEVVVEGKNRDGQVDGAWAGEGVSITAANITIADGAAIHADGQGYTSGKGPGAPASNTNTTGASYGGIGTFFSPSGLPPVYGSTREPVDLGSASGVFGAETYGGGAIRLILSGTLTVNGRISADGTIVGTNHSGATGGSIWITASTITGNGVIRANASAGGTVSSSRDSSGGRIALYLADTSGLSSLAELDASGIDGSQVGTVYIEDTAGGDRGLIVTGRVRFELDEEVAFQALTVESGGRLELGGGSTLSVAGDINVSTGGEVVAEGKNRDGQVNGVWAGEGVAISAANILIASGATIQADGQGYTSLKGPGAPLLAFNNNGAGHGGAGGGVYGGLTYGDSLEPTTAGSAGGVFGSSIQGGGVIRIVVGDTLTLDGMVTASGTASGTNHSGAAGGSIWVTAPTLKGSGSFQADASPGGVTGGNLNSSGGRVAVYYEDADDFTGFSSSSASAGGSDAVDGTIVFIDTSNPEWQLLVVQRLTFPAGSTLNFGSIHFEDATRFDLGENSRLTVNGDLHFGDAARFVLGGGSNLIVSGALDLIGTASIVIESIDRLDTVLGVYQGRGSTLVAGSLLAEAGSSITADGQGYPSLKGPGASQSNQIGASHGGLGSGASAPVYGDPFAPIELGSGTSVFRSSVSGGGAVRLVVPGEMVVDGTVSASGVVVSGTNHGGASGGSIWIEAGSLSGDGLIQADASPKGLAGGNGSSGGGRISISTVGALGFESNQIQVNPSDSSAESGTIETSLVSEIRFLEWLVDIPGLVFGEVPLAWALLEPGADVSSVLSLVDEDSVTILTESDAQIGAFTWDTESVADGAYTLVVTFLDAGDTIVGELSAEVFVGNDYSWHFGAITEDETWSADRLHVISNNLTINSGATVTVEPGAVVKVFAGVLVSIESGGAIEGIASEASPIIFTSILDDSVGGDSNQDGTLTLPSAGGWRGFETAVGGQMNLNEWVDIRYITEVPESELTGLVTWPGDRVQWIQEDITVKTGATLTIKAGAIVKFGPFMGIVLEPGAALVTEGTVAQPVIFTSDKDDQRGGDTNGDANTTTPAAGDWRWIYVNGATATFDHTEIRYGGGTQSGAWSGTGVIRTTGAAEVTVDNSLITESLFDGILAWGGPVTVSNTVFTNIDRAISSDPGSLVTVRNSTFDRNRIGILMHGGAIDVANTIIANSISAGLWRDFGQDTKTVRNTIFYNPRATEGNVVGTADPIGVDGNLAADPRFLNAPGGEFRLQPDSPAIDAADTTEAPDLDRNGVPRFNEPSVVDTGVPGQGGVIADIGAYEFADGAASEVDLLVTEVSGPAEARVGGTAIITWTVLNDGETTVNGPWVDEIWLVANPETESEILRQSQTVLVGQNVQLAPGESVVFVEEIPVSGSTAGLHRWKVRTNATRSIFEGVNRENNDRVSSGSTLIDLDALEIGGDPQLVTFGETGDQYLFRLDTGNDGALLTATAEGDDLAVTELYWAFDRLPSATDFDGRQGEFNRDDVTAFAPRGGIAYVLVRAGGLVEPNVNLSVAAEPVDFRITKVSPLSIGDSGTATLEVGGAQFDDQLSFALVSVADGTTYPASDVFATASNLAYPTFPLDGVPRGAYRVRTSRGIESVDSNETVTVGWTNPGTLEVRMVGDTQVRAGRKGGLTIFYRNTGNVDLVAPMMTMSAFIQIQRPFAYAYRLAGSKRVFRPPPPPPPTADDIVFADHFLGISSDGPAGVLRPDSPGEAYVLSFTAPADRPTMTIDLVWQTSRGDLRTFSWGSYKDGLRLPDVPDEGWDRVFDLLKEEAGETYGEVNATVARTATQLSRVGDRERQFVFLLMQTLRLVDPSGWMMNKGRGSAFGEILPDVTLNRAYAVEGDRVVVRMWGYPRQYQKTLDKNVFLPSVNDRSVLRLVGDHFELEEFDQARAVFRSDGNLGHVLDAYGNRVDFVYKSDKLEKVVRGDLNLVVFAYDEDGNAISVTNRDGGTTNLDYDSKGRLTAIDTPIGLAGTIEYFEDGLRADQPKVYRTNVGGRIDVDYDSRGRLGSISQRGGKLTFDYPQIGVVETSNGTGSRVSAMGGAFGLLKRIDLNGQTLAYLSQDQVTGRSRREYLGGASTTRIYDDVAKMTQMTDPLGNLIFLAVDDQLRIEEITDTMGRSTRYTYDDKGTRTGVVDAQMGTATTTLDSAGRIATFVDKAGGEFGYIYDDEDRLIEKTLPNDEKIAFRYNDKGRMTEAENPAGLTALSYLESGAIKRVTFPTGRWIEYDYDVVGRISKVEDDSGHVVGYRYDETGVLSSVVDAEGDPLIVYTIDAYGRQTEKTRANGTITALEHATDGTLVSLVHATALGDRFAGVDYETDSLGRRTQADSGDHVFEFQYDAYGQLTGYDLDSQSTEFTFDAKGNRLSVANSGTTVDYVVDSLDRYLGVGERTLEYDARGNVKLIKEGADEWTYIYDDLDRLIRVTGPGENAVYEYDALGYRIAETINGNRTELVPNPAMYDSLFAEHKGSESIHYIYSPLGYAGFEQADGKRFFYHFDGNGNTVSVSDEDGAVANSYVYLPYGEIVSSTETVPNRFLFGGQYGVQASPGGNYWIEVRAYDPVLGRFLSPDTDASEAENPYTYAANQPSNYVDFSGMDGVAGQAVSTSITAVSVTNLVTGPISNSVLGNLNHSNEIAQGERILAEIGASQDFLSQNWAKKVDALYDSGLIDQGKALEKAGVDFAPSMRVFEKATDTAAETTRALQQAEKGLSWTKGLQKLGTVASVGTAGYNTYKYQNGDPSVTGWDLLHDYTLVLTDGLGYNPHPVAQGISWGASAVDLASQTTFTPIANLWYKPEDPFGPSMRPRDGSDKLNSRVVSSFDPNDKSATGVGDGGYIDGTGPIEYRIRFENVATASAAAQQVRVADVLDAKLDWSTLELLEFGFNGAVIVPQQGASGYSGVIYIESDPNPIQCEIHLDPITGELTVDFRSFDEETGDWPADPLAGFLPPNDETGRGEGYIRFSIWPVADLEDDVIIENQASIVFDENEPIITNVAVNTIDTTAPDADIVGLKDRSAPTFTVSWAGDDAGGSGVERFDVYVSVDGGDWTLWQDGTEETSADYEGAAGSSYAFYVHATDALGFASLVAPTAQAQTIAGVSFLVNISNRGGVGTGANIMIPGFVINGTGTKKVLVRAVGPTLGAFGVPDVLENPQMIVFKGQDEVESNDDWGQAADQAGLEAARSQVGAFALESESADAALLLDLDPGSYTVQVSGVASATGVSLVELYDADTAVDPSAKLVNISNRGEVGTGASIMIPGFVVGGEAPKTVLIRGVGPTLGVFGVPGVLENPQLAVFAAGADTPFITNDDWGQATDQAAMEAARLQVGAFALEAGSADAAVLVTLDPGVYTVQVSGVADTEGVALVEIYEVE